MTLIRRILYPTDFSEASTAVLGPVVTLARLYDADVVILHVMEPLPLPAEGYLPSAVWQAYIDAAQAEATIQIDDLSRRFKAEGVTVTTRLATGPAVARILTAAKDEGADLIAVGTHGRTGLSSVLLGSVADKVVRLAACPVLTVRNPGMPLQRILFPTDFSPAAAAAWPVARRLAEKAGAKLDVVHIMPIVAEDPRIPLGVREAMGAAFRAQAEDAYETLTGEMTLPADRLSLRLLTGVPAAEIVLQAKHLRVGLIVMGTHGYSGVVRWWLGNVAQEVIRTAPCPVLTVRPGQGEERERGRQHEPV